MCNNVAAMIEEPANPSNRVVQDPAIMAGKPVVQGTRIPVEKVLAQLAYRPDLDEVFAIWPELTVDGVRGCLAYASSLVAKKRRLRVSEPVRVTQTA